MASEDQGKILEEAKKLSFEGRVAHKAWFVRAAAYEDIGAACARALDQEDAIFSEVGPLLAKGVADSNANAQDKALDALFTFLENTSEAQAARIAGPTCSTIAAKALKGRPGTVKKATDVCLALVEWEQTEAVLEPLFKAFGDKVPKVVTASLDIVIQAFSKFGPKVVKPQPITKALPALFSAKQEPVREGVKQLTVELSSWLGVDYVQGSLCGKMPDAMRKDVEKLMEEGGPPKKQPERFTKKEQAVRAAAEAAAAATSTTEENPSTAGPSPAPIEDVQQDMDSYEYAEPVDIIPNLDKDFWEGLGAKKWSERRDALQKLKSLASQPRLAPGDFGDVLRELKKIIVKDSNVVCMCEAIVCVGALAKSLRDSFTSSAKSFVSIILEKYKDPKTSVSVAVTESLQKINKYCVPLPDLVEDFVAALSHKNPKVKVETAKLLQGCVDSSMKKDTAKVHSVLLPVLAKAANDPAPDVREASMAALVALAVKAGNLALLDKVSDGFEDSRKKRLTELAAQRTGGGAAAAEAPSGASKAAKAASPKPSIPRSPPPNAAGQRAAAPRAGPAASTRAAPIRAPAKKGASGAPSSAPADDDDAALAGGTLSESEAKEQLMHFVGEEVFKGLQDAQWKERLTSMEAVLEKVKTIEDMTPETASMVIQGVAAVPGWSEKNFQVLGKAFDVITHLVNATTVGKKDCFLAIGGLVDKMADIKLKSAAGEALFAISETHGPKFVFTQLHKKASSHKNPKVLSESLLWMAKAVDDFGLAVLDVQQLIEWAKANLSSTNAAVRNATIQLVATCHKQLGPGLASMIRSDVKPALMTALEDSFKNNPQQQVVPTRVVRSSKPKKAAGLASAESVSNNDSGPSPLDPDELLPRSDISGQLGSKVIASLSSSNWKERNHTMEDIENIIRTAHRIQPTVGDLVPALKARLTDSNKNLVARALSLFGELAKAMGSSWDRVGRPVLQNVVTFVADNKKQVRDAAVGALDSWVVAVPAEKVVPQVVDFLAGAKVSSEGKVTGLRWVIGVVESKKADKCLEAALKAAATASGDKAVEVRETASALASTISQVHNEEVAGALEGLSDPARKAVFAMLGKAPTSAPSTRLESSTIPRIKQQTSLPAAESSQTNGRTRPSRPSPLRTSQSRLSESRENSVPNTPTVEGPCLVFSSKKEERLQKARFKSGKFEAPREYDVEELEEDLSLLASEPFRRLLFAKDFKRHMEAADILMVQLDGLQREVMSCMDLLLRWLVIRICDANTQCLLKVLDLTKALFNLMIAQEYQLADAEANTIMPCLIEKSGHNQDRLRQYNKELIRLAGKLMPTTRSIEFLMQGLGSKNNRTRVDCVDLFGELLEEQGLAAVSRNKSKPFVQIAQLVTERDKALRSSVLGALEVLYRSEGEASVWAHVGRLNDQQRSLIEERFKHVAKQTLKAQVHRRLDSEPNATDQSGSPVARVQRSSSANGAVNGKFTSNLESLQSIPFHPSVTSAPLVDDIINSQREAPGTPPPQKRGPGLNVPTPMPGKSPGEPSPPPMDIVEMEVEDDEELQSVFTEAFVMLDDRRLEQAVEGGKRMCFVLQHAAEGRTSKKFLAFLQQSAIELIKVLTTKTNEVFDWVLDEAFEGDQMANSRPCKYMANAILIIFDIECMAKTIPVAVLQELMFVLLIRLLDPHVKGYLGHNPHILRALNVLMFKIISNAYAAYTFEALIQLLLVPARELQRRRVPESDFTQLITKCLVRATRSMSERFKEIDVRRLLLVIHSYFMDLGVDEIRRRGAQDEKSLRMVKTLVHELCKIMGDDIRLHMQDIPRSLEPIPIIHVYVDLHLETLHGAGLIPASAPDTARSHTDSDPAEGGHYRTASMHSLHSRSSSVQSLNYPTASATITQRASKELKPPSLATQPSIKEVILPILQRIGVSRTSEQGLEELYTFIKDHPEVDTRAFTTRLSKDFHSFVEKGLQRLERRDAARLSRESSIASQDSAANGQHSSLSDAHLQSLGSRLGGLRLSGGSLKPRESGLSMHEVEQMQERMRTLRRAVNQ